MTINIPVKPYILRYLRSRYNFSEVYKISRQHALDFLLQELLQPKVRKYEPVADATTVLTVKLSDTGEYKHLTSIPASSIAIFNQFADEMLKLEFIAHVDALISFANFDSSEAIISFMDKYEFDDAEISFETLKKYYFRHKRRLEKPANATV